MKIKSLEIKDFPPIKNLKIDEMGDVVIIAGANGSGKSRLKDAIVGALQGGGQMSLSLTATRKKEKEDFGGDEISTTQGSNNPVLTEYIQNRKYGRGQYVGSLVQIDSKRNIQTIQYNPIAWRVSDPDEQETPSTFYYQDFGNRWQEFMNYIHMKVAAHDRELTAQVISGSSITADEIKKKVPHPLEKYKEIFLTLLPNKILLDIDPASPGQFNYKDNQGNQLPFSSLSSGEQEVVKIIFDVIRKDINHSIIIVDEPELHLHPTLTFKLVETLKTIGDHTNQFIFLTHSADLISTYYSTGNVYFIDSQQSGANQAHKLSDLNHSHREIVDLIGENLGLFAVGKKLIFVEGEDSSIDRLAYHSIALKYSSEAKVIPIGSVENLITLNTIEKQIRNSIFGIDFYMIRDKDGLSVAQITALEQSGRIKCLKRRHLENYFLDEEILFKVAQKIYITTIKPEITQSYLEDKMKEIAKEQIKINLLQNTKEYIATNHNFNIPTVKSLDTKDANVVMDEFTNETISALQKLSTELSNTNLKSWMEEEKNKLEEALNNNTWKDEFRGKNIFSVFCSSVLDEDKIKIRQAYIDIALAEKPDVFKDIKEILDSFI